MGTIIWLDAPDAALAQTGGKGASLVELHRGGFPVPPGFVVSAEAYARFVEVNDLQPTIEALLATPDLRVPKIAREACRPLAALLEAAVLPEEVADATSAAYGELQRWGGAVVAARSSALSEDAASASSAGLYETYLNLRDREALLDGVRRCYLSLWSQRAVQYRAFKGLGGPREAMAVVVMTMVPADAAGVAFTANPITGARNQIVINASWGLGEAVVSGRVTPDSFILDTSSLAVLSREIADKEIEIVAGPDDGSGTVQRTVAAERVTAPALDDAQLTRLGELCRAIEAHYGRPMDIEWASESGRLYVLQARPITALT